jgi:hypothetical protein
MHAKTLVIVMSPVLVACGWQHHQLTPRAQAVRVSKAEPDATCQTVGTFFTYKDCLNGMGTGNTDEDAQLECIKWKTDERGGNYAVLDAAPGDGYYKGRVFACPAGTPQAGSAPKRR